MINKKQRGFTVVEIIGAMILMGLGIALISNMVASMHERGRMNRTALEVTHTRSMASTYKASKGNFEGMTMTKLIVIGATTEENPWSGIYTVTPGSNNRSYAFSVTEISDASIDEVVRMMSIGAKADAIKTGNTVTGNYHD